MSMNVLLKMVTVLTSATTVLVATVVHVVMGMNRTVMVGLVQVSTCPLLIPREWMGLLLFTGSSISLTVLDNFFQISTNVPVVNTFVSKYV